VKDLRQSEKEILVLDAGDLLFKKYLNPLPENAIAGMAEKAHLIVESFNVMGYDAMGIGDDDLTLGKEFLLEISRKANFPLLSSNLLDEASGKNLFRTSLIKEINGLRIGLFSLLSPDFFTNPSDPRKKGLNFRSPFETAKDMVQELKPKTDLIILLSHLGNANDIKVAQTVPGINLILGAHTGINLPYPPVIRNIIILQTASRGMFGGRLDLLFYNKEPIFYNSATRVSLENNLKRYNDRLNSKGIPEVERTQLRRAKEEAERTLKQLQSKNQFTNQITVLHEQMKDDPDIGKMIEAYKAKIQATENPASPKS
jgi:2',3'-cyclic-nucleotide 2'-phosphodiesterase (5'-nucleotidase family)